jgi:hypothetical protein
MSLSPVCCPPLACPSRDDRGLGHAYIHSRNDQWFQRTVCHKRSTVTKDTVLYRPQTSVEMVRLIVTRLAHGCPLEAFVVTWGFGERSVVCGDTYTGIEGQAAQKHLLEPPHDLGQVPADQIRVKSGGDMVWMALAGMVRTHAWLPGEVRAHRERLFVRRPVVWVRQWTARRHASKRSSVAYQRSVTASSLFRPWRGARAMRSARYTSLRDLDASRSARRHDVQGRRRWYSLRTGTGSTVGIARGFGAEGGALCISCVKSPKPGRPSTPHDARLDDTIFTKS